MLRFNWRNESPPARLRGLHIMGVIRNAIDDMGDVVNCLVEQRCDVNIIDRVKNPRAGPAKLDDPQVAQAFELM